VELQGNHTAAGPAGIIEIDAGLIVQEGLNPAPLGDDAIAVPLSHPDMGIAGLLPEESPAMFLIELAPPAGANVGLIAPHLSAGQNLTAELDATVFGVGGQFDLELEGEVCEQQVIGEEFIPFEAGTAADEFALVDTPQAGRSPASR